MKEGMPCAYSLATEESETSLSVNGTNTERLKWPGRTASEGFWYDKKAHLAAAFSYADGKGLKMQAANGKKPDKYWKDRARRMM